jgi:peptidyl-prolyl cis-trans isomerase B (cyclophilin B)
VVSSKRDREREYARRRAEKWQAHVAEVEARRAKVRRASQVVLAVLVVAAVVAIVVLVVHGASRSDVPAVTPQPSSSAPASDAAQTAPDPSLAEGRTWTATLTTSIGEITMELYGDKAPQAVASFVSLAQSDFFASTSCHRLTVGPPMSVLQCGDPTGTGTGGPGYSFGPIENAPADGAYPAGTVAMARQGGNGDSMGSQFFVAYQDSTIPADAAGGYTVFGRVTQGLDLIQTAAAAGVKQGTETPVTPVTIEKVEVK